MLVVKKKSLNKKEINLIEINDIQYNHFIELSLLEFFR